MMPIETANRIRELARRVHDGFAIIDPLIEELTASICPTCSSVCCINRHSFHAEDDLAYLAALGVEPPMPDTAIPDRDPCKFLGASGCVLPRHLRPFRCTWYFCDPLISEMETGNGRKTRKLSADMQSLINMRNELLDAFTD